MVDGAGRLTSTCTARGSVAQQRKAMYLDHALGASSDEDCNPPNNCPEHGHRVHPPSRHSEFSRDGVELDMQGPLRAGLRWKVNTIGSLALHPLRV
jgi:hypothetical protein